MFTTLATNLRFSPAKEKAIRKRLGVVTVDSLLGMAEFAPRGCADSSPRTSRSEDQTTRPTETIRTYLSIVIAELRKHAAFAASFRPVKAEHHLRYKAIDLNSRLPHIAPNLPLAPPHHTQRD